MGLSERSSRYLVDCFFLLKPREEVLSEGYFLHFLPCWAETLELAASLLVLRRDTLWLIDGAGPDCDSPRSKSNGLEQAGGLEAEQASSLAPQPEQPTLV